MSVSTIKSRKIPATGVGEVSEFDLQAKYVVLNGSTRKRKISAGWRAREETRSSPKRDKTGEDNDESLEGPGRKDPALKNADEAEVKESPHASEISSSSLITVLVHLTVIFVCGSLVPCPSPHRAPSSSSNSPRCTGDLGVLTLTLELAPSEQSSSLFRWLPGSMPDVIFTGRHDEHAR